MAEENETAEEREHARCAPSSSYRWINCPGSISLIESLPKPPSSAAAERGTRLHEVSDLMLEDFIEYKLTGKHIDLPQFTYEEEEYGEGWVKNAWENVFEQSITGKAWGSEDKFVIDANLSMYGFCDLWTVGIDDKGRRHGKVVDNKTGYHYVPIKKNTQLIMYAIGMVEWFRQHGKDLDVVTTCIYQPKIEHEPYRCCTYTVKQLDVWKNKFVKAAVQIFSGKPPKFKTGDWCEFCPALGVCPKYARDVERRASLKIIDAQSYVFPEPERLTDEQLTKVVLAGSAIEDFVRACRSYAINRHLNSKPLAGIKVVEGSARRKWVDDEAEVAKQLEALGFDPWRKKLCPLTEAERKLGKDSIRGFTTFTKASPVLVPDFDARPELRTLLDSTDE